MTNSRAYRGNIAVCAVYSASRSSSHFQYKCILVSKRRPRNERLPWRLLLNSAGRRVINANPLDKIERWSWLADSGDSISNLESGDDKTTLLPHTIRASPSTMQSPVDPTP